MLALPTRPTVPIGSFDEILTVVHPSHTALGSSGIMDEMHHRCECKKALSYCSFSCRRWHRIVVVIIYHLMGGGKSLRFAAGETRQCIEWDALLAPVNRPVLLIGRCSLLQGLPPDSDIPIVLIVHHILKTPTQFTCAWVLRSKFRWTRLSQPRGRDGQRRTYPIAIPKNH